MDAIQQALEAAKQAAAHQQAAAGTQVAVAVPQNTAVGMPVQPGPKLTMETVMTGQMVVDAWLKAKEFGLLIGDKPDLIQDGIVVSIDMTDGKGFMVKKGIKAGNPAQYWYTADGVTCTSGGSWEAAKQKALAISPTAYEYRCVDLPMRVLEAKTGKSGELVGAGKTLGYTTSTTNWKAWEEFYQEVAQAGLLGQVVKVKLGYERRENKAKNVWGIVTFELVGALADEEGGE